MDHMIWPEIPLKFDVSMSTAVNPLDFKIKWRHRAKLRIQNFLNFKLEQQYVFGRNNGWVSKTGSKKSSLKCLSELKLIKL